jgi:Uma2 family endonuclease
MIEEIGPNLDSIELWEDDDENLESDWHRSEINLLTDVVGSFLRDRNDFYVAGNMFIYFNEEVARRRNFRGPDFFFVWGASREPLRRYWVPSREGGLYPNAIVELLSPRTARQDLTTKKDVYEKVFRTKDYFCYDPDAQRLLGWRLSAQRYEALKPNEHGWLWCAELEWWLGTWRGKYQEHEATWLRFYDVHGNLLPTHAEAEKQRADAAEQRAQGALAELAKLNGWLTQLRND